ncbi:MAG: serine/threonine-protein kinase PknK, partial [Persicimonas sp.]
MNDSSSQPDGDAAALDPIRMGAFDLHEFIGEGGMGQVWRGVHRESGEEVAIKIITRARARTEHYRRRFRREVRAMARLHHPGVITLYAHGAVSEEVDRASFGELQEGSPYLVMDLYPDGSLDHLEGQPTWEQVRSILLSLLDALAHAHARGVVHRDLKPGNLLLTGREQRRIVLTDFGLAFLYENEQLLDGDRSVCGTPSFMAPEQLLGEVRKVGPWSDLYGAGCLAYRLVCARPPFEGDSIVEIARKHIHDPIPQPEPVIDVPPRFRAWVNRLMQKEPSERYRRAADAAWGLLSLGAPSGDTASEPPSDLGRFATKTILQPLERLAGALSADDTDDTDGADDEPDAESSDAGAMPIEPPPMVPDWRELDYRSESPHLADAGLSLFGLRHIPLVGRHDERDRLWNNLKRVRDEERPRLTALVGPTGCGKSSLARWIGERADEVGSAAMFEAVHDPSPGGEEGFSRMLAHHLNTAGLERAAVRERLADWLSVHGVDDEYEIDALTEIIEPATPADVEAGQRKIEFKRPELRYNLILRALDRLADDRPMVVLLDDVQWSIDALRFARHCLESTSASDSPIFLIATARAEALAERSEEADALEALVDREDADRIKLDGLRRRSRRRLVDELLFLEPSLAREVADHTDGNPLFAVQLIGDWIDRSVLQPSPEGFTLREGESTTIPEDLYTVWNSRLDEVLRDASSDDLYALELAAVLGRSVDAEEWRAACEVADIDISDESLQKLFEHRLVEETDEGGRFVHGMLRECLIARARQADRLERLHSLVADTLGELDGDDPETRERLGRHLLGAERDEEAIEPLLDATRWRINSGENSTARRLIDLREEALDRLERPDDDPDRIAGRLLKVSCLLRRGERERALDLAERCSKAALDHGEPSLIVHAQLRKQYTEASYEERWETLQRAAGFVDEADTGLQCWWHNERGLILTYRGRYDEAREEFESILELVDKNGNRLREANALLDFGNLEFIAGDRERGRRLAERALEVFLELGNPVHAAETLFTLGDIARHEGDLERATEAYARSIELCEGIWPSRTYLGHANLALVDLERGRFSEARARFERCEEVFEE